MQNTQNIHKLRNLLWWKKMLFPLYMIYIYSLNSDIPFSQVWFFGIIIVFTMYRFWKYHIWLECVREKEELTLPDKQDFNREFLFGCFLVVVSFLSSIGVLYEKFFQELPRGGIDFDDEFILFFITAPFAIIFSILLFKEIIYSAELSEEWSIQQPDETIKNQE